MVASPLQHPLQGMIGEQAAVADVAIEHDVGLVPGLLANLPVGFAGQGGGGAEPGAQRVPGVAGRIESGIAATGLDDQGHRAAGQGGIGDLTVAIDGSEQGRLRARRPGKMLKEAVLPSAYRLHWTMARIAGEGDTDGAALVFLIGFRAAQLDGQTGGRNLKITELKTDQFRTTQRPGEAQQQQGTIALPVQAVVQGGQQRQQLVADQRRDLALRPAVTAAKPLEGGFHQLGLGRIGPALGGVRPAQTHQPALQGGHGMIGGVGHQVRRQHLGRGRQGPAPAQEAAQVGAVFLTGAVGQRRFDVGLQHQRQIRTGGGRRGWEGRNGRHGGIARKIVSSPVINNVKTQTVEPRCA